MKKKNKNPERYKPPGYATVTKMYNEYKRFARLRGISFELTRDQWQSVVSLDCAYCGARPVPKNMYCNKAGMPRRPDRTDPETVERGWFNMNGIDRRDNEIGYIINNCAPCCSECNLAKKERSVLQFIDHAKRVAAFQNKEAS